MDPKDTPVMEQPKPRYLVIEKPLTKEEAKEWKNRELQMLNNIIQAAKEDRRKLWDQPLQESYKEQKVVMPDHEDYDLA